MSRNDNNDEEQSARAITLALQHIKRDFPDGCRSLARFFEILSVVDQDEQTRFVRCLKRAVKKLRRDFPSEYRVVVKFCDWGTLKDETGQRCHAMCTPMANSWLIQIERSSDVAIAIDNLWHEWAHVLDPPDRKIHPDRWWDTYKRIVRHYNGDD